jgi:enoyl-CoA hydratase
MHGCLHQKKWGWLCMVEMLETGDPRIVLEVDHHVATLTIARPEKLNALDFEMILALERAALAIDTAQNVRVAIITGAGDKSFCAGGDIAAWSALSPENFGMDWVRVGHRAFDALTRMRQPLIAALNGHTLGGGFEVALTADFRIGEDHIKLGLPETGLGIIPGWSGTQRAVRRFGAQLIRRMALAGETFTAAQAHDLGLIDGIAPKGGALADAKNMAARIAARGPAATQMTKLMINAAEGEDSARAIEALGGAYAASHPQLATGIAAFKAKQKPVF